ncbi:MAG: hypothetical protein M3121_03260 [Chloroflexota bacterium]|nr:hypothetical protein [Chloroflexota bacterium]
MAGERVNVVVTDGGVSFGEVVHRAEDAGLHVEQQDEELGFLSGTIDAEKLAGLEGLEGIAVERERKIQLPPPESDIQ